MDLLDRVRRTIERHDLARPETRLLVALSGGSDSLALTHLLKALEAHGRLKVAALAHFNHQLRRSADKEEEFCRGVAASLDVPFVAGRADIAALARRDRMSLEHAAHVARHAFLEDARAGQQADRVALGHTRDDQAETFLLRLLRGAGAKGLGSMYPRAGAVVRPLIDCRRAELRAYLERLGAPYVRDESNEDVSIPRNRVRAELLPLLESRFNPAVVDALAAEAAVARDEHEHLSAEASRWLEEVARRSEGTRTLDITALLHAPRAVRRLVVRQAMTDVANGREIGLEDVERALDVLEGRAGDFDAPGQRVQRIGAEIVLTGRTAGSPGRGLLPAPVPFSLVLPVPGAVDLPGFGGRLSAEVVPAWTQAVVHGQRSMAVVQRQGIEEPLVVRSRHAGDRFQPLGLQRGKKLQDFFVDRKVARRERDEVPLVVDGRGRIVWVAGHEIDARFRVTDPAQAVIVFRLKAVGGSV